MQDPKMPIMNAIQDAIDAFEGEPSCIRFNMASFPKVAMEVYWGGPNPFSNRGSVAEPEHCYLDVPFFYDGTELWTIE